MKLLLSLFSGWHDRWMDFRMDFLSPTTTTTTYPKIIAMVAVCSRYHRRRRSAVSFAIWTLGF
jgi:hypothetical protein